MRTSYDVIVVGARCAGASTAMLLARAGYRVLVVDKATFPCDTVSTHIVHPSGVATLARWGLRDRLAATGCSPIDTYVFDFGSLRISGAPGTEDPVAYCPRRTILDKLLIDAAAEAGAEIRQGFVRGFDLSDDEALSKGQGVPYTPRITFRLNEQETPAGFRVALHRARGRQRSPHLRHARWRCPGAYGW